MFAFLNSSFDVLTCALSALFFGLLYLVLAKHRFRMFFKLRHGRTHALSGLLHLILLSVSFCETFFVSAPLLHQVALDCLVGASGTFLAYSAAQDFNHKNVTNVASGTLDPHATVTYGEMMEHVFYQMVNLAQIVFLHVISCNIWPLGVRLGLAAAVSSVWLARGLFPVHSFSANYTSGRMDPKSTPHVRLMYRMKKWQYVFYKHFLLHGLNFSVALSGERLLTSGRPFRVYWLLLNTSYVMEFFLQTLVKKQYMSQATLLLAQTLLMAASSLAAVHALRHVKPVLAVASLGLNFVHRHHEVQNCLTLLLFFGCFELYKLDSTSPPHESLAAA